MSLYQELLDKKEKLCVIGLGYVGMPIAVAFSKKIDVIGFDTNSNKIQKYKEGIDPTEEVGNDAIKNCKVNFTSDETDIQKAKFNIVAVPTPINGDKTPDLSPVISASEIVGRNLTKGSIVVYESTVYPGVTEDICIPILEKQSGLKCGQDFKIGYSPERINPGDKIHKLYNIKKIVSGIDAEALEEIASVYELVIEVGVHRASSIKVAEAAKVLENSQRDINIAFMNEVSMALHKMNIDTKEVIEAMNTKWNALGFYPGLVGGHCIGVDPYYFIYEAEKLGYTSQIISSARRINDYMGEYVGENTIKQLIIGNKIVRKAKIAILGITFKENCPDIRNSKVVDIIKKLNEYGIEPIVVDPIADKNETLKEYGVTLKRIEELRDIDCAIFAVAHKEFKKITTNEINSWFTKKNDEKNVIIDVKGILNKKDILDNDYNYWRL